MTDLLKMGALLGMCLLNSCSGGDDGNVDETGGMSNSGGASSGGAGNSGSGGSDSSGGVDASGGVGTGGSGPTEATDAFDPTLMEPSIDCRTGFEETYGCISVSGTIDGQEIDVHCTRGEANGMYKSPNRFPMFCDAEVGDVLLELQVRVPVLKQGGPFAFVMNDTDPGKPEFLIQLGGRGGNLTSGNLESGAIHGVATYSEEVGFFTYDEVAGTFRMTLNDGSSGCDSGFECAAAQIHGTFYGRYASNLK